MKLLTSSLIRLPRPIRRGPRSRGLQRIDCGNFMRKQRMRIVPKLIELAADSQATPQMRNWTFMACVNHRPTPGRRCIGLARLVCATWNEKMANSNVRTGASPRRSVAALVEI